MLRRLFIYFVTIIISGQYLCFAETTIHDRVIEINKGYYSIAQIIEKLEKIPGLNLSYNPSSIPMDMSIYIDIANPDLSKLFKTIQDQSPVEMIQNENYLIIRQRKLEKTYSISGKVTDGELNEFLIGVNVYVKESKKGTVTGYNGQYSFNAEPGIYTLVFSFIGYSTKEITIRLFNNQKIDVVLFPEKTQLDEVKIIGERQFFGDLKEGRTIETIEMKELELIKINNVSDVLQARMPGVWVTKVSGAPGDHNQIRIRGINSLFGGVDPLYVIDGVSVPIVNLHSLGISDLNIHDVENITVLKDASSNAIYGFQGGNGVIIIDTKRGGDKEISFSVTKGIQETPVKYDLLNSVDFKNSLDSAAKKKISFINSHYPDITDTLCDDNWQDNLFQIGVISEYQLSSSGKVKKTNYHFSGNYYSHEGIIKNSDYSKYSFSGSFGHNFFNRLTIEGVYKTTIQKNNNNLDSYWGNRVILEEINKSPSYNCTPYELYVDTLKNSEYLRTYIKYPDLHTRENPDSLIKHTNKSLDITTHNFSGFSSFRVLDDLLINYSLAYSTRNHTYNTKIVAYKHFPIFNNYLKSSELYALLNNQFNITYNKEVDLHNINFVASSKFYRDMVEWHLDSLVSDFNVKTKQENIFTRGNLSILGEQGKAIRHINSFIGHLNYNYAQKYFVSLAANYENLKEGSTRNISKLFPSVALKWNVAREIVFTRLNWLDNFNLLYNYGISGNYPLNGLSSDLFASERYLYPDKVLYGYSLDNLANHNLKPEIVKGYNTGLELSLFKERIGLQVNYFSKTNDNLIIQRDIPFYYGGGRIYVNIAEMQINGYEFKFELWPIINSNWQWYNRIGLTTFHQKVNKLDGNDKYFFNSDILIPDFVMKENEELGSILGYEYLGKIKKGTSQKDFENVIFIQGGMYSIIDSNYSILDSLDKVVIGNMMPDYTFNFLNSIQYKNFSIDMLWYGVFGVDKFNSTRASTYISGLNSEINQFIADTNQVITSSYFYQSSYFVEDASFIRLKNISLSYSPAKPIYKKIKLKVILGIDNLVTFTRYKGYDPETTIYTDNTFSDNAVDLGAYPNPRSYYISLNLKF